MDILAIGVGLVVGLLAGVLTTLIVLVVVAERTPRTVAAVRPPVIVVVSEDKQGLLALPAPDRKLFEGGGKIWTSG